MAEACFASDEIEQLKADNDRNQPEFSPAMVAVSYDSTFSVKGADSDMSRRAFAEAFGSVSWGYVMFATADGHEPTNGAPPSIGGARSFICLFL